MSETGFEIETTNDDFIFDSPVASKPVSVYFTGKANKEKKAVPFLSWPDTKNNKLFVEKIKAGVSFSELKEIKGFTSAHPNCLCGNKYSFATLGQINEPGYRCSSCKTQITLKAFSFLISSGILNLKTAVTDYFIFPLCENIKGDKHVVTLSCNNTEIDYKTKNRIEVPKYLQYRCSCNTYTRFVFDKNKKEDVGVNKFLTTINRGKKVFNKENIPTIEKNSTKVTTNNIFIPGGK